MKKLVLIFLLVIVWNCTKAQIQIPQLEVGKPIDTVIYNFNYGFSGTCLPVFDVKLEIDPSIVDFVSGIHFYGTISGIPNFLDSVLTDEVGFLLNGDTIWFDATLNSYTFHSPLPFLMSIDLHLAGTPQTPFELYPCDLVMNCTLGICQNTCLLIGSPPTPFQCMVDDLSSTNNNIINNKLDVYPNPASDQINIKSSLNSNKELTIKIFNSAGKLVFTTSQIFTKKNTLDISTLSSGIYTLIVMDDIGNQWQEKLVLK